MDFPVQPVKIYSNLEKIELFQNGKWLGVQNTNKGVAVWNVPFVNGRNFLFAKGVNEKSGYEDGIEINFEIVPLKLNQNKNKDFELAVNVGSNCFFIDPINNTTWFPDQEYKMGGFGYLGGEVYRSSEIRIGHQSEVNLTRNVPLYQTFRFGLTDYKFDVADGEYEVELHFSDLESKTQKSIYDLNDKEDISKELSEFNVSINGAKVLEEFSPAKQYGALNAIVKTFVVTAKGLKGLTISFEHIKGNTLLNAIKIRRLN